MKEDRWYRGELGWKEIPMAGIVPEPGTSVRFKTGDWRAHRPIVNFDKCTNCLLCWIYCPDIAIERAEMHIVVNYNFCKGCGICAKECPVKAIEMVEER